MLKSLQGNNLRFKTMAFFLAFVFVFTIVLNSTSNIVEAKKASVNGGILVWLKD